jgi:hypothetical protein
MGSAPYVSKLALKSSIKSSLPHLKIPVLDAESHRIY